jgi:putative PIN family toxin of toxin-antitoxin system
MIFLQAAARANGPAAALLELVEIGELELFTSIASMEELGDVLTRPSLQRTFPALTESLVLDFMDRIKACSVSMGNVTPAFVFERDPKDAKYIDLAIACRAEYLVTRDTDLLDLREQGGSLRTLLENLNWECQIVDPVEMLTVLRNR